MTFYQQSFQSNCTTFYLWSYYSFCSAPKGSQEVLSIFPKTILPFWQHTASKYYELYCLSTPYLLVTFFSIIISLLIASILLNDRLQRNLRVHLHFVGIRNLFGLDARGFIIERLGTSLRDFSFLTITIRCQMHFFEMFPFFTLFSFHFLSSSAHIVWQNQP